MRRVILSILVIMGLLLVGASSVCSYPIIHNRSPGSTVYTILAGPINGIQVSSTSYKFLGIPYAQAPTGNRRFASPVPYPPASLLEPINATAFGNICPQESGGAEDCLSLNIFTGTTSSLALRPVMFWIHGGSLVSGTGSDPLFDGTKLSQMNVVVVTFNYRLGILGFLDGGNGFPTVNMGLQDTILALTWVRNNIGFFGGDPSRITVFGESSGGSMIRALISSPKATNLFARAIIQSDPQNYPLESRAVSRDIVGSYALSALGCSNVTCARSSSLSSIVSATTQVSDEGPSLDPSVPITPLFPTIDGTWVKGDFSKLITSGSLPVPVDLIMGTLLNEATPQIFSICPAPVPEYYFQPIMEEFVGTDRTTTICAAPEFALNSSDPDCVRNELSTIGTLFMWTCPNQANAIAYQGNVYLYEMTLGITHPDNAADPLCAGEVCHEDDIEVVFGTYSSASSQQIALSNEVMGRWTAFAAHGNPNIPGKQQWTPVSSQTKLNALRLGTSDVVNQTLYGDICGPIFGGSVPFNYQLYD